MDRFDISGSVSKQTGLERKMAASAIRREIEPKTKASASRAFVAPLRRRRRLHH